MAEASVIDELERLRVVMDGAEGVAYARARAELAEALVKRAGFLLAVVRAADEYYRVMTGPVEQSERQLAASRAIARRESIGCDAWSDRAVKAEKANALLRAECEAWRKFEAEAEERSWSKAWPVHADWIADAQNATDAAGALKGVE